MWIAIKKNKKRLFILIILLSLIVITTLLLKPKRDKQPVTNTEDSIRVEEYYQTINLVTEDKYNEVLKNIFVNDKLDLKVDTSNKDKDETKEKALDKDKDETKEKTLDKDKDETKEDISDKDKADVKKYMNYLQDELYENFKISYNDNIYQIKIEELTDEQKEKDKNFDKVENLQKTEDIYSINLESMNKDDLFQIHKVKGEPNVIKEYKYKDLIILPILGTVAHDIVFNGNNNFEVISYKGDKIVTYNKNNKNKYIDEYSLSIKDEILKIKKEF